MTNPETAPEPPTTDPLLDHNYDGIQEYDNPLPGWWTWLFVASIIFSFFYWIYFQSGVEGRSIHERYTQSVADNLRLQFAEIGDLERDRKTIVKYIDDSRWKTVGEVVFKTHCVSCHGSRGEGNIGPNLTDKNWKNVRQIEDIAKVIAEGAADGAMPSWEGRLHQNEVVLTASYIASMLANPVPGRLPEGDIVIEKWAGID